jgi:hypothetical protein
MRRTLAIAALVFCAAPSAAGAHHSLAPFIQTTVEVAIGRVKEFAWTNPHTRLVILVRGANGADEVWDFEGVSTSRLAETGFKKEKIVPGEPISVVYNPRRDHAPGGMFVAVTLSDGTTYRLSRYQRLQGGGQRLE